MDLQARFEAFVAERDLLARDAPVVVGVSGGVDSVALLHLLVGAGFQPVAVHVNYGLRGAESDADEALVRELCTARDVELHVERAVPDGGNTQEAARNVRYEAFGRLARRTGARAVATAHHRGDQAETLLLNLFRGTGPVGLGGMPVRRRLTPGSAVEVVRPLLFATRAAITAYAEACGLLWREDASNREGDYRRTALRHTILPAIEAVFGESVQQHVAAAADLVRAHLDSGAALAPGAALDSLSMHTDGGWILAVTPLSAYPAAVRRGLLIEALRRWAPLAPRTADSVRELDGLLDAQPGRCVVWPGLTVWRDRSHLVFTTETVSEPEPLAVGHGSTVAATGTLCVEPTALPERYSASRFVEYVAAERLRFPLTLRPWREGDVLKPLGMDGHKNVSDLLTDCKVPPQERARQLVLTHGGEIVWVVGHRLAEAFRVRPESARVVRLAWTPGKAVDGEEGAG